jgi:hypothetical protein
MAVNLIFAPEAEQDIAEAYGWYEGRRLGLGEEFLSSVDACIQAICRTRNKCNDSRELPTGTGATLPLCDLLRG